MGLAGQTTTLYSLFYDDETALVLECYSVM